MGTLLIDKDELLAHSTDDGNTLTEISGAVMRKKLWSDVFDAVIDGAHWSSSGAPYRGGYESGTVVESGGLLVITGGAGAAGNRGKHFETAGLFNNLDVEVALTNPTSTVGKDTWYELHVYKDANNFVFCGWNSHPSTVDALRSYKRVGGAYTSIGALSPYGGNAKFRIVRSGNTFTLYYDIGAGWVSFGSTTAAIGADCKIGLNIIVGKDGENCEFNDLLVSGSGIYWDTKGDGSAIKDTYNEQDVGAGATIEFGSATFTQGSNMKYDYKIGSAAWQLAKTSAEIIALGDQVTDTGKFNLRAVYQGSTAQASWTSISVTWVSGVKSNPALHSAMVLGAI